MDADRLPPALFALVGSHLAGEEHLRLIDHPGSACLLAGAERLKVRPGLLPRLGGCTGLRELTLAGPRAAGDQDLNGLEALVGLRGLDVSACGALSAMAGRRISGLARLEDLTLADGHGFSLVDPAPGLRRLRLLCDDRGLTSPQYTPASCAPRFRKWVGLRELVLDSCRWRDAAVLESLPVGLVSLKLSNCPSVDAAGVQALTRLPGLRVLCAWIQDLPALRALARIESLQELSLRGPLRSPDQLDALAGLGDLRSLHVQYIGRRSEGLAALRRLTRLERLHLTIQLAADHCCAHLAALSWLRELVLHSPRGITEAGWLHLGTMRNLHVLQTLLRPTDAALRALSGLVCLRVLRLAFCSGLTAEGLQSLRGLPQLRELHLWHAPRDTPAALEPLQALTVLDLSTCELTDASLVPLTRMPALRRLVLRGNPALRQDGPGLSALRRIAPNLDIEMNA